MNHIHVFSYHFQYEGVVNEYCDFVVYSNICTQIVECFHTGGVILKGISVVLPSFLIVRLDKENIPFVHQRWNVPIWYSKSWLRKATWTGENWLSYYISQIYYSYFNKLHVYTVLQLKRSMQCGLSTLHQVYKTKSVICGIKVYCLRNNHKSPFILFIILLSYLRGCICQLVRLPPHISQHLIAHFPVVTETP